MTPKFEHSEKIKGIGLPVRRSEWKDNASSGQRFTSKE